MDKKRVVITGLGIVSSAGIGKDEFSNSLKNGISGITNIEDSFDTSVLPVKVGGEIKNFNPSEYVPHRKSLKLMAKDIKLAVGASKLAVEDASLDAGNIDHTRMGVTLGSGLLNTDLDELGTAICESKDKERFSIQRFGDEGIRKIFPLWLLKYLPNMLSSHVSIIYDAQGPSNSITTGCTSSIQAIGEAFRVIQRGSADIMISGGAEAKLHPTSVVRFKILGLLSNGKSDSKVPKPFDSRRDGMVLGEAGGVVILEELSHAVSRGAKIYAEVLGFASLVSNKFEIDKVCFGSRDGANMKRAMNDGQVSYQEIEYICANGTGTVEGDAAECTAIEAAFGERAGSIPVSSIKPIVGHSGAASGSVDLVAACIGMNDGFIPPTINFSEKDSKCDIDCVPNKSRKSSFGLALINSYGLRGQSASMVIRKYEG